MRERRHSSRARRWARRAAALLLGLLLGLASDEALARAFGLGQVTLSRGRLHAFHPEVGWTCYPHCDSEYELPGSFRVHVRCNAAGMRDRERTLERPHGAERIAVLGDSFMWGFGVENEQTLSARLERLLAERADSGAIEVLNFGVNGYSTAQELVRYECDARDYGPRLLVLAVCWNDLEDNFDPKHDGRVYLEERDETFALVNRPVRAAWKAGAVQWLRHSSRFYGFLEYATEWMRLRSAESERRDRDFDEDERGRGPKVMRFTLLDLHARETPEVARGWRAMSFLLAELQHKTAADGARLLVVFDAIKETRSLVAYEKALLEPQRGREAALEIEIDRPARRLERLCAELGLPFLDLGAVFRAHATPDALFLRRNNHWSAAGHAVAAEALAREIEQRGLDPRTHG